MARSTSTAVLGGMIWLAIAVGSVGAASWADGLFAERAHDFGSVPRGGKFRHDFLLTNRLGEPITVLNVRASCGCTTGRATAAQLLPGQSARIEAEMDTRNFVGAKSTTLFVTLVTADGREGEARLGLTSNILSDIVLNPGTIEFGAVVRGQPAEQVLTIERLGDPRWKVERMISASRVLSGQLVETNRNESSVQYKLTLALRPDAPAGLVRDEIRLLTNDPETPNIPIAVSATIRGDLSASPSALALGRLASAGGAQGRFLVRASKPFTIMTVEGGGDGFTVSPVDSTRSAAHLLTVSYRPEEGRSRGDLRRVFRVITDLPGEPPLELTVTGHVDP
jgi:Protein of unknown function (DUF1573)